MGAERRHLDEVRNAGGAGRLGHGAGAEGLHGVEALTAAFRENTDEIDDGVGALDGAVDRPAIAQIGLHRHDLADRAERLHMAGEIGSAHRDADAPAALRQRTDRMAADETGPAEDRDQLARLRRHAPLLPPCPADFIEPFQ